MKCPVCPANDIPDDSTTCPVCKTDLGPLQRVRQLHVAEYNEAVRLAEAGAVDLALRHALAALALSERFVPAIVLVGKLLWRKGHIRDALDRWEEAANLAPSEQDARDLLSFGRTFVKRERIHRVLRWSGIVLAAVFLGCLLPLAGAIYGGKRMDVLSSRVAGLEKMLEDQMQNDDLPGGAVQVPTQDTRPHIAEGLGASTQVDAVMKQIQALSDQQAAMSLQLEADIKETGALTAALVQMQDQGGVLSGRVDELIAKMRTLPDWQEAVSLELKEIAGNARAFRTSVMQLQAELAQQQSNVNASMSWARETVRIVVEAMRPQCMNELENGINDAENEVSRLKEQEACLRKRVDLMSYLRHRSVKSKLREVQIRLATLYAEWQEKVVPWLILKEQAAD